MAESLWYTQKAAASSHVQQLLADGQERPIEAVKESLRETGVSAKNALKAIYTEVQNGTVVMTGDWTTGTIKKGGA